MTRRQRLFNKSEPDVLWWFCVVGAALLSASASAGSESWTLSGKTMGTSYSVVLADTVSPRMRNHIGGAVAQRLSDLEAVFSTYRNDSAISEFNRGQSLDWRV